MKRRVTRYNDRIGPELSSGMIVLVIFLATVVILCVYFACNSGVQVPDRTDGGDTGGAPADAVTTAEPEAPPYFPEDITDTVTKTDAEMRRGFLILVNAWNEYSFGADDGEGIVTLYHNEEKSSAYGLATSSIACRHDILPYLNEFIEAYVEATNDGGVILNSGYRTYEDQDQILKDRIESDGEEEAYKFVSRPGQSEHHTGLSMDIASNGENYDPMWMPQNCQRFGFVQRYRADKQEITGISSEYWHYRYVGVPHAEIMTARNLCLEEYLEMLRDYSYEHPFEAETSAGDSYVIYYTPCAGDGETDIKVPRGTEYTISGDNVGGFIVTVKLANG